MASLNIAIAIGANTKKAMGPIGRLSDALSGLNESATRGFSSLQNIAKAAGGALVVGIGAATAAIVGLGAVATEKFIGFENQMNEVFTLLPEFSETALGEMSDQALQFSEDFGVLPEETIPALYQAISASVPPDNVFAFLETANQAATGGVTDLETAVDGLSSVVNAYGDDVLEVGRASDIMFTTVRLGKTDFKQLSATLFNVIPTAASLGVVFEDVAANLAVLTAQGTPTSVATTQIRAALDEASDSGSKLGQAISGLTGKSFTDLIKSGLTSSEIFDELRQSMPEAEFRSLFSSVEAKNAVLGITGKNAAKVAKNFGEMKNAAGATEKAFETMDKGLAQSRDDFRAFVDVALIRTGEALSPLIDLVVEFADDALPMVKRVLNNNIIPAIEMLVGVIGGFVSNLQEGMSPLDAFIESIWDLAPQPVLDFLVRLRDDILPGLSAWFTDNVKPVIDMVTSFVSWQDVLVALGLVVAAVVLPALLGIVAAVAPVIVVGALLIGAVALLRKAWEENWGGIQEKTFAVIEFVKGVIQQGLAAIQGWWAENGEEVIESVNNAWDSVSAAVSSAIEFITPIVQDALAAIQGWWAENGEEVIENVENTWNTIRDAIELVIEVVSTAVENGLALIKAFWAEHGESIMAVVSLAWENIKTIFNGAVAVITAVITAFQAAREGDWQAFGEQLRVIWDTIWETIATVLRNQITALGIIAKDIVNSVIGFFTGIDWSEVGKNIILGIIRGISGAKSLLQDAARDAARAAFEATTAFLGINSESSLFRNEVGVNIGVGAASGIMNSGDQIQEAMRSVFNPGNLIGAGVSPGGQPLIGAGSIPTLAANGDQQAEVGPMIKIDTVIINANDEAGGQRAADSFVRDLRDRGIMI